MSLFHVLQSVQSILVVEIHQLGDDKGKLYTLHHAVHKQHHNLKLNEYCYFYFCQTFLSEILLSGDYSD